MAEEPIYRYPGLYTYEKEDADIFMGRKEEAENLFTQIKLNKTLVLHAESGIGKSSLLRAGLLPLLEKAETNYRIIIVNLSDIKDDKSENILIREVINGILIELSLSSNEQGYLLEGVQNSLWSLSKKLELEGKTLILAFDQFESLLNFSRDQIIFFKRQLFEMLDLKIPEEVYSQIEPIIEAVHSDTIITKKVNESYQFLTRASIAKVLFIVREDKLGVMSNFSDLFPDILKNDFIISALSIANAKKAIIEPAKIEDNRFVSNSFSFEPEKIVDDLIQKMADSTTKLVDPVQLQIVTQNFERKIILQEGLPPVERKEKKIISEADIPAIGNIMEEYYKDIWMEVRDQLNLTPIQISDIKYNIISNLVKNERRALVISYDIEKDDNTCKTISELKNIGFLRQIPGENKTIYYQLSHDRLMIPILEDLKDYQAKQDKLRLEEQDRKNQKDLAEKETQLEAEKLLKEEAINARQRAKILSRVVIVLGVAFSLFGWYLWDSANKERTINKGLFAATLVNLSKENIDGQDIYAALSYLKIAKEYSPSEVSDSLIESFNTQIFKGIVYNNNERIVYSINKDAILTIWDVSHAKFILLKQVHNVLDLAADEMGNSFAVQYKDSTVEVYNKKKEIYQKSTLSFKMVANFFYRSILFSKNGSTLAYNDSSNSLKVFTLKDAIATPYVNIQLMKQYSDFKKINNNKNIELGSFLFLSQNGQRISLSEEHQDRKSLMQNHITIYDIKQKTTNPIFKTTYSKIYNETQNDTLIYTNPKNEYYLVDISTPGKIISQKLDLKIGKNENHNYFISRINNYIASMPINNSRNLNLSKFKDSILYLYDLSTKNQYSIINNDFKQDDINFQTVNSSLFYQDSSQQLIVVDLITKNRRVIVNFKTDITNWNRFSISKDGSLLAYNIKDTIFVKHLNSDSAPHIVCISKVDFGQYPFFLNNRLLAYDKKKNVDDSGFGDRVVGLVDSTSAKSIMNIYPEELSDSIRNKYKYSKTED